MRVSRLSQVILAAGALLAAGWQPAAAASQTAGMPAPPAPAMADAIAAIEAAAPAAMAYQGTPGLSIAITDATHTIRIITLGYANVDTKAPVTPQTRFAVGSITKSMTVLALLQLYDAGKLDLNAPVSRYLPWFSIHADGRPILVHELLSHTAGIPDDYTPFAGTSYRYGVVALRNAHTLFRPGTGWSYSNDGIDTAGAILATLEARVWPSSLQSRVFDPLGMTDSYPVFTPATLALAATPYQYRTEDRPYPLHPTLVPSPVMDFVDPAWSVLSTPEDMAKYMRFYLNGGVTGSGKQLLRPATFAAMTHADSFANGKPAGSRGIEMPEAPAYYKQYGFGLSVFDANGDHLVGHTGGVSGYTACMQMNVTRGFGVIAMANLVEEPLHPCAIVLYAMAVLRAQNAGLPLPAAPAIPDPAYSAHASDFAGTYAAAGGKQVRVVAQAGHVGLIDGAHTIALYPRGKDLFWADDPQYAMYLLAFGRNKAKAVVEMSYGPSWYPNERYTGPRAFTHPASWDALTGRYESYYGGFPYITRVVIVKDTLTFDGIVPLKSQRDGTFKADASTVTFDSYAGPQPQRLNIDATHLYRVELP
jgi:D-alanyl-D-alanine carboxypeptidase